MYQIVGACGACGGNVVVPTAWYGIFPPTPSCHTCGRKPKDRRKVIEMQD